MLFLCCGLDGRELAAGAQVLVKVKRSYNSASPRVCCSAICFACCRLGWLLCTVAWTLQLPVAARVCFGVLLHCCDQYHVWICAPVLLSASACC